METKDDSLHVPAPESGTMGTKAMKSLVAGRLGLPEVGERPKVGKYEVGRPLGSGGMGQVFAAWDPELERSVALKLLHRDRAGDERRQRRLVREAQALAKLSHPNVVQVYEAGRYEEGVFVAMELVDGQSLRHWQRGIRTIGETVAMYVQAARGLHAAHRADLVHRDFKPGNAIVAKDGRVRVVDFGLAYGTGLTAAGSSSTVGSISGPGEPARTARAPTLTLAGTTMGTPAYMAPEQFAGKAVDGRTDQFSFCVALYEAIAGARPYEPDDVRKTRPLPPPISGSRPIPRPVRAVLIRGLSLRAEYRYPDMEAVARALEAAVRSRRWKWLAAAALTVGAAGAVIAARGVGTDTACELPEERPATTWSVEAQAAVRRAAEQANVPFANDAWTSIDTGFTAYAADWDRTYSAACKPVIDPAVASCLSDYRHRFDAGVEMLTNADAEVLRHAVDVVDEVGTPMHCREQTEEGTLLPAGGDLVERLQHARVASVAGQYDDADRILESLLERKALEGTSTHAQVLKEHGIVLLKQERFDRAREQLLAAGRLGHRGDPAVVEALLAWGAVLTEEERYDAALAAVEQVEGYIEPAVDKILSADLFDLRGRIALEREDVAPLTAVRLHRRALKLRSEAGAPLLRTQGLLANALDEAGDVVAARELYEKLRVLHADRVGRRHPDYAAATFNLALVVRRDGQLDDATKLFRQAMQIDQGALGMQSSLAARSEVKLAQALGEVAARNGDPSTLEQAVEFAQHAWSVQRRLPRYHSDREAALRALASLELTAGLHEASLQHHMELDAEFGVDQEPSVTNNIVYLMCLVGRCAEGAPWVRRARVQLELFRDKLTWDEQLIIPLFIDANEAWVEAARGNWERAKLLIAATRQHAERIEIPEPDSLAAGLRAGWADKAAAIEQGISETHKQLDETEALIRESERSRRRR